jgi:outer membrane lipoprotein-sorting protein
MRMRPLKFLLLALCGLAFSTLTYAQATQDVLAQLNARLSHYPVLRADFVQTRQVAALKKPLISRGHLVISRQYGVLWEIEQPLHLSYVLGDKQIVEIGADGQSKTRDLQQMPGMAQVARIFRALLDARSVALREYFDIDSTRQGERWVLRLVPRQQQLAQYLSQVDLSGEAFVESIRIEEASGDSTRIEFKNSTGASQLDRAEIERFGAQ